MDQPEKKELLKRMREALKKGRAQRKADLHAARQNVDHERSKMWAVNKGAVQLDKAMEAAQARKMLATTKLPTLSGGEITLELGSVKKREAYEKRPSVRAQKRQKSNGRSMDI